MSPEMQASLVTLGVVAAGSLTAVLIKTLLDVARAARELGSLCQEARTVVPAVRDRIDQTEQVFERLETVATQAEAVGAKAKNGIEEIESEIRGLAHGGRKAAAWAHGLKVGVDSFRSMKAHS